MIKLVMAIIGITIFSVILLWFEHWRTNVH